MQYYVSSRRSVLTEALATWYLHSTLSSAREYIVLRYISYCCVLVIVIIDCSDFSIVHCLCNVLIFMMMLGALIACKSIGIVLVQLQHYCCQITASIHNSLTFCCLTTMHNKLHLFVLHIVCSCAVFLL